MRAINFDHASGYAVDERVVEEMLRYFREDYGNPSSTHSFGQKAKYELEEARKKVASFINAESEKEIVFTSGATEANNLAIKGYAFRNAKKGKHIIISAIEHLSVINCAKYLQKHGFKITYLPVDEHGIVDLEALKEAITPETILISVMHANNEIGTIEPISEIAEIAQDKKIAFHCDATASCGKISVDVEKLGVSMLTISSNDLHGPRGIGALYMRKGIALEPILHGGGQERGLRSGTENLALIAGFAKACEIASKEMQANSEKMKELRDRIINGVLSNIEETMLTGHREKRLPNHASFIFKYIEGESIVLSLDMEGILASSGSACTSKTLEPSHVLLALGLKHEEAHGSLSLTLGRENTIEDVNYFLDKLPPIIERLRAMSPLYKKKEVKT